MADNGVQPGAELRGEWEVHGKGQLGTVHFEDGWNGHICKSFADPDMVSHSGIHAFIPPHNGVLNAVMVG